MTRTDAALLGVADAAREVVAALDRGEGAAVVMVVSSPSGEALGRRLVVTRESVIGDLGSAELQAQALNLGRECLEVGGCRLHPVTAAGDVWELYVECQMPHPELVIVGAGHIAQPLSRIAAMVGFRVTVLDDRPEFARDERFPEAARVIVMDPEDPFRDVRIGPDTYLVLVTRAHKYDYDCIRYLLNTGLQPSYLGMIGSRRRVRAVFEALLRDGIDPERLETLRAPIGLDVGAETPEEIAVSIVAELIQQRRGGSGAALAQEERVLERVKRKRERGEPS